MESIIEVKDISKEYKTGKIIVKALDDVNFSIDKGQIVVLLGRSGSGKSTLLNIVGGLMNPDKGNVIIEREKIYGISDGKRADIRNKKIGYIYQDINLINELNIMENIRLPFDIAGKEYDIEYEREVIKMLNLEERINFYPCQLSGGERQRAAIARALIKKPSIILADEPNGNIDFEAGKRLMKYVKMSNEKMNQTYFIVTHDYMWLDIADSVFQLVDGKITPYNKKEI